MSILRKGLIVAVIVLLIGISIVSSTSSLTVEKQLNEHPTTIGNPGISLVTIKVIEDEKECGWYSCNVPFIMEYESDEIASIFYSYNSGEWTDYYGPFEISEDGKDNFLEWHAFDHEGNLSEIDGPFYFNIDQTPPDIEEVEWEAFKDGGKWYAVFTCYAEDEASGMDKVEMYINDGLYEIHQHNGPEYTFKIEWSSVFHNVIFTFVHYDKVGNSIEDEIWYYPPGPSDNIRYWCKQDNKYPHTESNVKRNEFVATEKPKSGCSSKEKFPISSLVVVVDREMGKNDWIVGDVNIDLIPDDDISELYYKLDNGDWTIYTESLVVSEAGDHEFSWYVIDSEGYSSSQDSISFKIDQTPPEIILIKNKIEFNEIEFTADVYDETSGIEKVEFYTKSLKFTDYDFPYAWIWEGYGNVKVTVKVYDTAGNVNTSSIKRWSFNQHINNFWHICEFQLFEWLSNTKGACIE